MLVVGLTGGIGAGKSSFAALLAEHGAQVIDADAYGREALRPGQPAWHSVVDQFGEEVLSGAMEIDRKKLAGIVFKDKDKLAALNAIVHPVIFAGIADSLERLANTDSVAVIDAAIIVETGMEKDVDILIVVGADDAARLSRLRGRGMSGEDVRARMAIQAPPHVLQRKADIVVDNNGTLEELAERAEKVWKQLEARSGS